MVRRTDRKTSQPKRIDPAAAKRSSKTAKNETPISQSGDRFARGSGPAPVLSQEAPPPGAMSPVALRSSDGVETSAGSLDPRTYAKLEAAVRRLTGDRAEEARRGLGRVVDSPIGPRLLVSILTGRPAVALSVSEIEAFSVDSVPGRIAAQRLAELDRRMRIDAALARLPASLEPLRQPLSNHLDAAEADQALTLLEHASRPTSRKAQNRAFMAVVAVLIGARCLPADNWQKAHEIQSPARAVAALARRQRSGELEPTILHLPSEAPSEGLMDDPVSTQRWASELFGAGLAEAHRFRKGNLVCRLGLVGEALRLAQIAADPGDKERHVEQGIVVVRAPPGLIDCQSFQEAQHWCKAHKEPSHLLQRFTRPDGGVGYGMITTEIDVSVFDQEGELLKPVRIENVKASPGAASSAWKQNKLAIDGLSDPHTHYLFEDKDGLVDRSERLMRTPEVVHAIRSVTVGPPEDVQYTVGLPLSRNDIVRTAELMSILMTAA